MLSPRKSYSFLRYYWSTYLASTLQWLWKCTLNWWLYISFRKSACRRHEYGVHRHRTHTYILEVRMRAWNVSCVNLFLVYWQWASSPNAQFSTDHSQIAAFRWWQIRIAESHVAASRMVTLLVSLNDLCRIACLAIHLSFAADYQEKQYMLFSRQEATLLKCHAEPRHCKTTDDIRTFLPRVFPSGKYSLSGTLARMCNSFAPKAEESVELSVGDCRVLIETPTASWQCCLRLIVCQLFQQHAVSNSTHIPLSSLRGTTVDVVVILITFLHTYCEYTQRSNAFIFVLSVKVMSLVWHMKRQSDPS